MGTPSIESGKVENTDDGFSRVAIIAINKKSEILSLYISYLKSCLSEKESLLKEVNFMKERLKERYYEATLCKACGKY